MRLKGFRSDTSELSDKSFKESFPVPSIDDPLQRLDNEVDSDDMGLLWLLLFFS